MNGTHSSMKRIAETFVNLGLLKSEFVTEGREPAELAAFNQANSGEQVEILAAAEQLVIAGVANVQQAAHTTQDHYPTA